VFLQHLNPPSLSTMLTIFSFSQLLFHHCFNKLITHFFIISDKWAKSQAGFAIFSALLKNFLQKRLTG
jgi:hypothetical protein